MWIETDPVPDVERDGVGMVLVGEWTVRQGDQRRAADAALAAWPADAPPDGMLAHHCLLGEDGATVLHYQQWSDPEACRAFVDAGRPRWLASLDAQVPGIAHRRATAYQVYRSTEPSPDAPPCGCLVTVTVDFDGPDGQRQRDWIDTVFTASGTDRAAPAAGLIAAHFHVGLDGTRVLNLAAWSTGDAHRRAAATPAPKLRTATQRFPGVAGSAARRFTPYRGITAQP